MSQKFNIPSSMFKDLLKKWFWKLMSFLFLMGTVHGNLKSQVSGLDQYNVVWNSPGKSAVESMPCGGGNIALNVWTNRDELVFYIGSSDSWVDGDVPGRVANVKIGRVRLNITPNPFSSNLRQELEVATNTILVSGESVGGGKVQLKIWVDALKPVVHVEGNASSPVNVKAQLEIWRGIARFDGSSVVWNCRNEGAFQGESSGPYYARTFRLLDPPYPTRSKI